MRTLTHYYENLNAQNAPGAVVRVDTTALSTAGPDHPTRPG